MQMTVAWSNDCANGIGCVINSLRCEMKTVSDLERKSLFAVVSDAAGSHCMHIFAHRVH